jgi:dihydrofolate synthase/folylpolyglutamate synthase
MDYQAARALLDRLPRLEVKPGLSRIERLLDALGHPERAFPAVHVAGTNGKGSVVAMLDAVLREGGYRIGRFTSPELIDFRDRIAIDGDWLPEAEWAAGIERMEAALVDPTDPPTQFEAVAALAFDAFSRHAVDIALVEVGLGGRFDATNVVRPLVSVLCNVSLDHSAVLGGSIEEIAWEKAGIAKAGIPLLHGDLPPAAEAIVLAECDDVGAVPIPVAEFDVERTHVDWGSARYRVARPGFPESIESGLLGGYQRDNLQIVLAAIELLRERGFDISEAAVLVGLRHARWPGRFEVVRRRPNVVLEGAHNVAGAERLAADIETFVPERGRRQLLLGMLADKDIKGIGRSLAGAFDRAALCTSESPRALPIDRLREAVGGLFLQSTWYDSVVGALDGLVPALADEDTLVVAGSLTVVAEARRWFEEDR